MVSSLSISFFRMQSPVEPLSWQLNLKTLKAAERPCEVLHRRRALAPGSITGYFRDLSTETFLFLPLLSIQVWDNKSTSHSCYERLIWTTSFSWQVRIHCCWGNRAEWEPDCKRDAEDSMALRCICPVPREGGFQGREATDKIGRIHWGFWGDLVLWCFIFTFSHLPTASTVSCAPPAAK